MQLTALPNYRATAGSRMVRNSTTEDVAPQAPAQAETGTAKKLITGAAYTGGGTMGGLVLGGIGGALLTNISHNPAFSAYGGTVGAAAGAISGLAASISDQPGTLKRTLAAWTTATAGSALGMWAVGGLGNQLATNGASAMFGVNGALVGAMAGGLAGASLSFIGHRGPVSASLKHAGAAAAGGAIGWMAGGLGQVIAHSAAPHLPQLAAAAPALGAITGGLVGVCIHMNPEFFENF